MNRKNIDECAILAHRFNRVCNELLKEMDGDVIIAGTKKSGAVRRLSMELTRKLAELRAGK